MIFVFTLLLAIAALIMWRISSKKIRENNPSFRGVAGASLLAAVIFCLATVLQCFTQIPAGYVGVVDFFGIVSPKALSSGINLVNPLARVVKLSVQTKEHKETMQVLSREGLTIGLEMSALYRLNPDSAARVYQTIIGGNYEEIVLIPQFRSISRSVTASFNASALYSTERERLGVAIQAELARAIAAHGVIVESTPLRNVALPTQLRDAIE